MGLGGAYRDIESGLRVCQASGTQVLVSALAPRALQPGLFEQTNEVHAGRPALVQALLTTVALSMLIGPLLVRYNSRIADALLRRPSSQHSEAVIETAATRELAKREHVIICGFGRVGQNLARVLEQRARVP